MHTLSLWNILEENVKVMSLKTKYPIIQYYNILFIKTVTTKAVFFVDLASVSSVFGFCPLIDELEKAERGVPFLPGAEKPKVKFSPACVCICVSTERATLLVCCRFLLHSNRCWCHRLKHIYSGKVWIKNLFIWYNMHWKHLLENKLFFARMWPVLFHMTKLEFRVFYFKSFSLTLSRAGTAVLTAKGLTVTQGLLKSQ